MVEKQEGEGKGQIRREWCWSGGEERRGGNSEMREREGGEKRAGREWGVKGNIHHCFK